MQLKFFYLKQELSRTTTNLRIFQKLIGNKIKEKYEEKIDKIIKKMFKVLKNFINNRSNF